MLLFVLAELSFRTPISSYPSKTTLSFLDPHVLALLCTASLLRDKGKESISILLLAPLLVAKVPLNQCYILSLYCI